MSYQPLNYLSTRKFKYVSLPIVTALSLLTNPIMSMADGTVKAYCQDNPDDGDTAGE